MNKPIVNNELPTKTVENQVKGKVINSAKANKGLPTRRMDHVTAYLMILPAFALLLIFVIIPLFMALEKSFTNWTFYKEAEFVGLNNFRLVLTNELFRVSIINILRFVIIIVPTQIVVTFFFAHILKNLRGKYASIVKTSIYIPTVISGVVASVIFIFILDYRAGIMNEILKIFGINRVAFLTDPVLANVSIIIPTLWLGFGYSALVIYAGLINIPKEYYEAAQVDGANVFDQLIRITIPSMKNIFVLLCINMVTGTLQMFDLPFVMTGGGPMNKTLTPMIFLYNNFKAADKTMGLTLAGALLIMIVIALLNSVVFKIISSEKSMDA